MALYKQNVDVKFEGGVARSTDDFLTLPTKLSSLINARFVDKTTIRSRSGISRLINNTPFSGNNLTNYKRMVERSSEISVETDQGFHVADPTTNRWRKVTDTFNRCCAELSGIAHPPGDVLESDIAGTSGGLFVTVWTDVGSFGGGFIPTVYVQVQRGEQILLRQQITSTESCSPRVIYSGTKFYIYWVENNAGTGNIKSCTISEATPTTLSTTSTVESTYMLASTSGATTGVPMLAYMDATYSTYTTGGSIFLAHRDPVSSGIRFLKLSVADGYTINASVTQAPATWPSVLPVLNIAVTVGDSGTPGVSIYKAFFRTAAGADQLRFTHMTDSAFVVTSGAVGGTPVGRVVAFRDSNNRSWVAWDENSAGTTNSTVAVAGQNFAGFSVAAYTVALRSVGLAAGFFETGKRLYLGVNLFSTTQPSFYAAAVADISDGSGGIFTNPVFTSKHDICARVSCLSAPIKNRWQARPPPRTLTNGVQVVFPIQRASQDLITIGTIVPINNVTDLNRTPVGLDLLSLDFSAQLNSVEVDTSVIMAGADPQFWDGESLTELGFEYYPEPASATAGGVGTLPAGTYQITYLYEWIDRTGLVHQSAPAIPISLVVGANQRITVTVSTLRLTKKDNVRIVVFRTVANGSTFYRVQGDVLYSNAALNSTAVDSITFASESLSDVTVAAGELLPTTGGVVAPEAFPSCKHISMHQDRLFFSGLLDKELIQYTEERLGVFFPWTNAGVYILEVATESGRCSATISMDDKLFIFQEKAIGTVFGRGPNRLGQDNSFSNYIRNEGGYGLKWSESKTIVQDTEGVWFRDQEGMRHFNRGMTISQIEIAPGQVVPKGSEVDFLVTTTAGAVVFHGNKQVAIGNTNGILIWDFEFSQWSFYQCSHVASDWAGASYPKIYNNQLAFLTTSGVFYEHADLYWDEV